MVVILALNVNVVSAVLVIVVVVGGIVIGVMIDLVVRVKVVLNELQIGTTTSALHTGSCGDN